jgi:hypothetical protein
MIIKSAAHLSICACGEHGRLITSDGEESRELCSRDEARRALDAGVKKGKIFEYEVGVVVQQINASSLAATEEDVSPIAHITTDLKNYVESAWMEELEKHPPDPLSIN